MAAKLLVNALPVALTLFVTAVIAAPAEEKVRVVVYYESYCPDSIAFLTEQLYPVFKTPLASYMNLTLVPYGKSKYNKNETGYHFECHHGPKECTGNKIMACILNVYQKQDDQLKLINCTSSTIRANPKLETYPGSQCASELSLDYSVVQTCAETDRGDQLLAALGNKTYEFQPELTRVPSVVFNEKFNSDSQSMALKDFKSALCAQITGKKPDECPMSSAVSFKGTILTVIAAVILTRI